jgi:hypothetical protein
MKGLIKKIIFLMIGVGYILTVPICFWNSFLWFWNTPQGMISLGQSFPLIGYIVTVVLVIEFEFLALTRKY